MSLGDKQTKNLLEIYSQKINSKLIEDIILNYWDQDRCNEYKLNSADLKQKIRDELRVIIDLIELYEESHPDVKRDLVLPMAIDNDQGITYPPPRRVFAAPKPGEPVKGSMYIPVPPSSCCL